MVFFVGTPMVAAQEETIRVKTNLVTIPVTVLHRDGRFVTELEKGNFQIFENSIEQEAVLFETTEVPISVMILIDVSSSMTPQAIGELVNASNTLVQKLRPDDQLIAATYSYHVYPVVDAMKVKDLKSGIKFKLQPFDAQTLIYDAVDYSLKKMRKIRGRKAIILFGDGTDSGMSASIKSTLRDAEEQEALIYTVQSRLLPNAPYTDPKRFAKSIEVATDYMKALAQKTGGRHFMIDDVTNLQDKFGQIADELRTQYTLGYYPTEDGKDGERRRITVKVNIPNVAVRSRNEVVYKKPKK
ncbi:MAG: VWA domain-containing protein [Pyrinomonadaceae bacterium]